MRSWCRPARRLRTVWLRRRGVVSTAIVCSRGVPIASGSVHPGSSESGGGSLNFEIIHDSLWLSLGFHHRMHVIASHVGREQIPAAITTYLLNGLSYCVATGLVHVIGRLIHASFLLGGPCRILVQNRGPRHIVRGIYGT